MKIPSSKLSKKNQIIKAVAQPQFEEMVLQKIKPEYGSLSTKIENTKEEIVATFSTISK